MVKSLPWYVLKSSFVLEVRSIKIGDYSFSKIYVHVF